MTALVDLRDAIVDTLATAFPTLTVEAHGGRFTAQEIPLWLGKAPCLLVAPLSIDGIRSLGLNRIQVDMQWACYAFMRDAAGQSRDDITLDTVYDLMTLLAGERWTDAPENGVPVEVQAANLYSGEINNLRVSVWAVTWSQTVALTST